MQFKPAGTDTYLIRLDPGEDIVNSIQELSRQLSINNAVIWGIGSIEQPTLAHYRLDHKKFSEQRLEGIFEIVSLQGNVGLFEGEPMAHIHLALSDESMQAFGGHLVKGVCSATVELVLRDLGTKYAKTHNADIGLNLWGLDNN